MTTWKTWMVLTSLGALVAGCGVTTDDCLEVCEQLKGCESSTQAEKEQNCETTCDTALQQAEDNGCTTEFDELWSCGASEYDCASDAPVCEAESNAYNTCASAG